MGEAAGVQRTRWLTGELTLKMLNSTACKALSSSRIICRHLCLALAHRWGVPLNQVQVQWRIYRCVSLRPPSRKMISVLPHLDKCWCQNKYNKWFSRWTYIVFSLTLVLGVILRFRFYLLCVLLFILIVLLLAFFSACFLPWEFFFFKF